MYKNTDLAETAESLHVSERTGYNSQSHQLTGHFPSGASVSRLTSLEEMLVLDVIFENPGIYSEMLERRVQNNPRRSKHDVIHFYLQ